MASFLKKLRGSSGAVDQTDGRTRTATGSTSNGQFSSHKWITTERKADGQQLVANKVDHVYKTLGSSPCNLISIEMKPCHSQFVSLDKLNSEGAGLCTIAGLCTLAFSELPVWREYTQHNRHSFPISGISGIGG